MQPPPRCPFPSYYYFTTTSTLTPNNKDVKGATLVRDYRLKEASGGTSKGHQADYPGSRRSCGDSRRESSVQKDASSRLAATPLASSARCMKATCHCGGAFRFTK